MLLEVVCLVGSRLLDSPTLHGSVIGGSCAHHLVGGSGANVCWRLLQTVGGHCGSRGIAARCHKQRDRPDDDDRSAILRPSLGGQRSLSSCTTYGAVKNGCSFLSPYPQANICSRRSSARMGLQQISCTPP